MPLHSAAIASPALIASCVASLKGANAVEMEELSSGNRIANM